MIFNDNNTVVGWIESCVGLHSYSIRINSNSNTVDINSLKVIVKLLSLYPKDSYYYLFYLG